MGDYTSDYTFQQMKNMGFLKDEDVPFYLRGYRFYFRLYDLGRPYASAYLNIGDSALVKEGVKVFKNPGPQFKKALRLFKRDNY